MQAEAGCYGILCCFRSLEEECARMGDRVCRLKQDVMAFFVASGPWRKSALGWVTECAG